MLFYKLLKVHYGFMKINMLIISLFFLMVLSKAEFCKAGSFEQETVTLSLRDSTLRDALGDIFKQTGYKIVVSDELPKVHVAGEYKDVSIDIFLRRIFRNYNVIVVYDDKEQVVIVRAFGEDFKQSRPTSYVAVAKDGLLEQSIEVENAVDPLSGIPLSQLKEKEAKQLEELEKRKKDPEAMDPLGGIPVSRSQSPQDIAVPGPDAVDPLSGIPITELRKKQSIQEEELKKQKSDPLSEIPLSELPK